MSKNENIDLSAIKQIAIGASAGGIQALNYLLAALPTQISTSIIIVEHLAAEQNEILIDIFNRQTANPVLFAEDKMPLEAGKIYVAPPNFHLLMEDAATFALSVDQKVNYSRPSIDVFLESAAAVFGKNLLAIILTGANNDGSAALEMIKQMHGTTIAQAPAEAEYKAMPTAAIATGKIDHVLDLAKIATLLAKLDKRKTK
ncbi:MAG: chemotaxis protein CheB [Candidatus Cloacimonadales bacterium]